MADYFTTIPELGFSTRVQNCLSNRGIKTLGDLVGVSEVDLLRIPEFGRKSLREMKDRLGEIGWELGRRGGPIRDHAPPAVKQDSLARIATALEAIVASINSNPGAQFPEITVKKNEFDPPDRTDLPLRGYGGHYGY